MLKRSPMRTGHGHQKEQKQEFVTDFSTERLETRRWCRVAFKGRKCTQSWISPPSDIGLRREDRMERQLSHQEHLLPSRTRVEFPAHAWWLRTTCDLSSEDPILLFMLSSMGASLTCTTHKHITKNSRINV